MSRESINILVVSFPAQGHLNPMVQFCTHLATKGVKVTLVLTERAGKYLQTPAGTASLIEVELIPDVLPEGVAEVPYNTETTIAHLRASFSVGLPQVIEKRKASSGLITPKVVLYDSIVPWILELAKGCGLQGAALFTQPCCVSAFYYHVFKGDGGIPAENSATAVVSLPGMPPLGANDLPSFTYFKDDSQFVQSVVTNQFVNIEQVDWIFFNTFDKLEEEILKWMRSKWAVKTIGPLIPSMYLKDSKEEDHRISLFKPHSQACMDWLSMRQSNSVVYVSFGSVACLTEQQMAEIATALAESNHYFLWVVRESEETKLPKDFKSKTWEKGLIVKWCPQLQVLSHGAIVCFMTHCGWNSTLEALMLGVPMIALPQWADQQMNAKFVVDVWETGVRPKANQNGIVTKEEIQACIHEMMEEEKGNMLKKNGVKWKGLAEEAVLEGGSSHSTIQNFISHLSSI